jgi:hypothetical protein
MGCIKDLPLCVEAAPTFFFLLVFVFLIVWKGLTPLASGVLLILGGLAKKEPTGQRNAKATYDFHIFGHRFRMTATARNAAIGAGLALALAAALAPSVETIAAAVSARASKAQPARNTSQIQQKK